MVVRAAKTFITRNDHEHAERALELALDMALSIREDNTKALALRPLERHLSPDQADRAFEAAAGLVETIGSSDGADRRSGFPRLDALATVVRCVSADRVPATLDIVRQARKNSPQLFALIACSRRLDGAERAGLLAEIVSDVLEVGYDQGWLLSELIPELDGPPRERLLEQFVALSGDTGHKLKQLTALVPRLREEERELVTQHALDLAPKITGNVEYLWHGLAALAPYFSASQFERAREIALEDKRDGSTYGYGALRSDALLMMARRSEGPARERLVTEALTVAFFAKDRATRVEALAVVAACAEHLDYTRPMFWNALVEVLVLTVDQRTSVGLRIVLSGARLLAGARADRDDGPDHAIRAQPRRRLEMALNGRATQAAEWTPACQTTQSTTRPPLRDTVVIQQTARARPAANKPSCPNSVVVLWRSTRHGA